LLHASAPNGGAGGGDGGSGGDGGGDGGEGGPVIVGAEVMVGAEVVGEEVVGEEVGAVGDRVWSALVLARRRMTHPRRSIFVMEARAASVTTFRKQ
jgi:hypothetical protein